MKPTTFGTIKSLSGRNREHDFRLETGPRRRIDQPLDSMRLLSPPHTVYMRPSTKSDLHQTALWKLLARKSAHCPRAGLQGQLCPEPERPNRRSAFGKLVGRFEPAQFVVPGRGQQSHDPGGFRDWTRRSHICRSGRHAENWWKSEILR